MRSFVCGQCHVEYYCGVQGDAVLPLEQRLKVEQIEQTYDEHKFPDGTPFYDFEHGETGAHVYKAQHPEFELWSQGIHARSGVSCADCHMPYERQGAMKVSSHWVRSPLLNINRACQTCHNVPEAELRGSVETIQDRDRGRNWSGPPMAMTDMLDAIREAKAAGATPEQLAADLRAAAEGDVAARFRQQRELAWASTPTRRRCGSSASRSTTAARPRWRPAPARARGPRPSSTLPIQPVQGVTPTEKSPAGAK